MQANATSPSTPKPSPCSAPTGDGTTPGKAAAGDTWTDIGFEFTGPDGTPLHPRAVTGQFEQLAYLADLPPIRLHDLRHFAATLHLAAGVDVKIVQDMLGHSSRAITSDTWCCRKWPAPPPKPPPR